MAFTHDVIVTYSETERDGSVPFPAICAASLCMAIQHNNLPYATKFLPFGTESDLFIFSTFWEPLVTSSLARLTF
jgi:hypothetical protein